ncbi:MAG: hypothetical protein K2K55_02210 [Duncaniella sp.]|nr:hypothetical protein [Duncaniella sp.]
MADQVTHYYPWGSVYGDMGSGASLQPFKYGDKELDLSNGVARYDYSARAYFPSIPRFDRIDNCAVKYAHQAPYIFCGNNPVNFIDPDGNDWYETDDKQIIWTNCKSQIEMENMGLTGQYLGEAYVVFEGDRNEKLGTKNERSGYIDGEGAVTANVTVYGPGGENDIHSMTGFTMSSDKEKFGAIAEGLYKGNYDAVGKSGKLKSNWTLNHRGPIPMMDGMRNPLFPNQIDSKGGGYKTGIFIHATNASGKANGNVSQGCLLMAPGDFRDFNKIMNGVQHFSVQVSRKITFSVEYPNGTIFTVVQLKRD